jgi:hypothetical protein
MRRFTIELVAILILFVRSVEAETPGLGWGSGYPNLFRITCRALIGAFAWQVVESLEGKPVFAPQADGGGDGGGGDGGDGSGGDGGSGDSGGDAGGGGGDGDGNGDAATGDTGAVGDQGDPGNDDDASEPSTLSDPTTVDNNDVVDVPTNDPSLGLHGPNSLAADDNASAPAISPFGSVAPIPLAPGGLASRTSDVGINAVIVSGAPTPWEAIGKGPGIQNVTVIGGIVALGENGLTKPPLTIKAGASDDPPAWLKIKADLRYLNGSVFPPVVPNVIDIRIISNAEDVIDSSIQ